MPIILDGVSVSPTTREATQRFTYDVAMGNVKDCAPFRAFGHNIVVAVAWETVHCASTLRTYLAAGERLQVTSADADDDGAPLGNGARTLRIDGLDDNYDPLTETVTMNGVANVTTDASFLRVLNTTVATAGATGFNEGIITVSNNADTVVLEQMHARDNRSLAAAYTVKKGYTAYVTQAMATESSSKGCHFGFWARTYGGLWIQMRAIELIDNAFTIEMSLPMMLPERTDVEIRVYANNAGAIVTAGFEGWIEAN